MVLPWVSRGRYEDMRERAELAEERVDRLLDKLAERPEPTESLEEVTRRNIERNLENVDEEEEYPLPPLIEEAISRRVQTGSPLHEKLARDAHEAIERLGPEFDEQAYADEIIRGTRVEGWPH